MKVISTAASIGQAFKNAGRVSEIVRDARDDARVPDQRDGGQCPSGLLESTDQFLDEVTRLRRTPSVAECENLSTRSDAGDQGRGGSVRCWLQRCNASLDDLLMLAEMFGEMLWWHARIIRLRRDDASAASV